MADLVLIVIVLVLLIWIGAALWNVTGTADAWRNIGGGPFSMEHDVDAGARERSESPAERERDLRALIEARNERRAAKGLQTVDVDEEMARLDATPGPLADPGLEAEVRAMVIASNERRVRAGREPLDVDAEVTRRLAGG